MYVSIFILLLLFFLIKHPSVMEGQCVVQTNFRTDKLKQRAVTTACLLYSLILYLALISFSSNSLTLHSFSDLARRLTDERTRDSKRGRQRNELPNTVNLQW